MKARAEDYHRRVEERERAEEEARRLQGLRGGPPPADEGMGSPYGDQPVQYGAGRQGERLKRSAGPRREQRPGELLGRSIHMQQAPMPPQQQPQPVVQQQQQLEPPVVDLSRSQAIPVLPPDLGRSQLLSQSASSQAQPGPQPSEIEIPQICLLYTSPSPRD